MKKYVDVETGKEIKLGQEVVALVQTPIGKLTMSIVLDEQMMAMAIRDGLVREEDTVHSGGTNISLQYYVDHMAARIGWKPINLDKYLFNLSKISLSSVFEIMLREIAIVLDEKYPDHIEKSELIFCVYKLTGKIVRVKDVKSIKNFRNFAAFRTLDNAMAAKHILKVPMKELFARPVKKGGKQEG